METTNPVSAEGKSPAADVILKFEELPEALHGFRTVNWDGETKMVSLVAKTVPATADSTDSEAKPQPKQVLLKIEPISLPKDASAVAALLQDAVNDPNSDCQQVHDNDIFKKFKMTLRLPVMAEVVYPCPDKLVLKATSSPTFYFEETPETYETRTKAIMVAGQSALEWVTNIITGVSESNTVIHRHEKFVVCKDYKQANDCDPQELHYLAFATDERLMSIRDLDGNLDLEWLQVALKEIPDVICKVFGGKIRKSEIRAYFHYWPTFHRLHVHYTHVAANNGGVACDRARLLQDVIRSLQADPHAMKKATFTVGIKENDANFPKYEDLVA